MRRLLSDAIDIVDVGTAEAASRLISDGQRFDAILCDVRLGGQLSSAELYAHLLASAPDQAARLVLMSGLVASETEVGFARELRGRWLAKPIDRAALLAMIDLVAG